jgi:CubicO group peptidase (beta-lactamase class C family)
MIIIGALLASLLVDGNFAAIGADTPGCAVAVSRNDRTVVERAYGQADLNLNVPLTPKSIFYIASDSKQFTAASVALLIDEGKLQFGDSVVKWIPELPAAVYAPVTIRDLIHHTSGVRDYWGLFDIAGRTNTEPFTQHDFLQLMARQRGLNFKPGSRFEYSNSGYALLAIVVERASGQPLAAFAATRIFRPLGMMQTSYGANHGAALAGLATGYGFEDGDYEIVPATVEPLGDGGVRTTVGDLLLWLQNLAQNRLGTNPQRVGTMFLEPGRLNNGDNVSYAFGLGIGKRDGYLMYDHTGSYAGFQSFVAWLPQPKLAVAVLCNAESPSFTPWGSGLAVIDEVLGATQAPSPPPKESAQPVALAPAQLQSLTGTFIESDGTVWKLTVDGSNLVASVQGIRFILQPFSPSDFHAVGAPQRVELYFAPNGVSLQVGNHAIEPLTRFTPPAVSATQLHKYTGSYYSSDLDLTLYVYDDNGKLYVRREGAAPEPLQPVALDDFRRGGQDVHFQRNSGGIRAFTVSASGADDVLFIRAPGRPAGRDRRSLSLKL